MHYNECYIHSSLKKSVSFRLYFFCCLVFDLFDHVFFITFDVDCDGDGLSIASVQGVENGRELCEMVEGPFCTARGICDRGSGRESRSHSAGTTFLNEPGQTLLYQFASDCFFIHNRMYMFKPSCSVFLTAISLYSLAANALPWSAAGPTDAESVMEGYGIQRAYWNQILR